MSMTRETPVDYRTASPHRAAVSCCTPRTRSLPRCLQALLQGLIPLSLLLAGGAVRADEATMTVTAPEPVKEDAWGSAATIAAKRSVSGSKTATEIKKIPQSLSVVTRQELDTRQPQSVKEALGYTAGVMVDSTGPSAFYDNLKVRGFGEWNLDEYMDGLRLQGNNYAQPSVDPYLLERIEVLRGPSSVLYGRSNPGGVVSLFSKQPTGKRLREIQFKAGTRNLWQTGFDFGDVLNDDARYSWRLTGVARSGDTQAQGPKEKRYSIAPSFRWQPDEHTSLTLLTSFQHDPDVGFWGWLPRQGTVVPFTGRDGKQHKLPTNFMDGEKSTRLKRSQNLVGYRFSHDLNDNWQVRQNLRYMHLDSHYFGINGNGYKSPQTLMRASAKDDERLSNMDVDTQLEGSLSSGPVDHRLLFGVDYVHMRDDMSGWYGGAESIDMLAPHYGNDKVTAALYGWQNQLIKQQQTGLYTQDQAQWKRWLLTLGGRYDWAMTSSYDKDARKTTRKNDAQFTWRGGLNYLFNNGVTPYFGYSESFEPTSGTDFDKRAFVPSRGKQYEVGVKYLPSDRPVSVTAALFQLTRSHNLMSDPNHFRYQIQTGKLRSRGVELEAKGALNANINATAAYTYTDMRYSRDLGKNADKRPAQVPKNMASAWLDYTFHETALSGLKLGSGVRYVGSAWGNSRNDFKTTGFTVVDALMSYDLARFNLPGSSLALNVQNLFDRHYVASCGSDNMCFWGNDRRIIATATFQF